MTVCHFACWDFTRAIHPNVYICRYIAVGLVLCLVTTVRSSEGRKGKGSHRDPIDGTTGKRGIYRNEPQLDTDLRRVRGTTILSELCMFWTKTPSSSIKEPNTNMKGINNKRLEGTNTHRGIDLKFEELSSVTSVRYLVRILVLSLSLSWMPYLRPQLTKRTTVFVIRLSV